MEISTLHKLLQLSSKVHIFTGAQKKINTRATNLITAPNIFKPSSSSSLFHKEQLSANTMKVFAMRRRRANIDTDTYVLMEPGKNEEFVSEDELRERLKGWLESWPGQSLPPDLARFETIDDAVQYLVKSVCELEIDGDVGSLQWYQVRLD